jgi:RNA polymerase sigma-70 factor (sigma-E family)
VDARTEARYLDFVAQATPALFRVAYALTGRQQDAEDLLQTALERLVPRWRRVDDPMAYVRKVIYHEHIGRWRRWGRRELSVAELPGWALCDGPTSDDHANGVALRQALRAALGRLGPRQRAVLVLRYLEDRSEAEVAELLGCSPKTVASQASRALARLRTLYAGRLDLTPVEEKR